MPQDAFTAGVVPGGLNSHSEVKILVCYLLGQLQQTLPHDALVNSLTAKGLVNYFELAGSLSELLAAGHIQQGEEGYSATETGLQIAEMLGSDLPLTVRERALEEVRYAVNYARKRKQNQVKISETDNGFSVTCTITDEAAGPLFSLTVYAATRKEALTIGNNFVDKAEELLRNSLSLLTGEQLS